MPAYIEVIRHFFELGPQLDAHPAWLPRRGSGLTWQQLLQPTRSDHIVLLAPSGYGKSTEVFEVARRLCANGARAIAADAVAIAEMGLRDGLTPANREQFDAWLQTTEPAILFIDAVDELALRHKTLRDLIRKLEAGAALTQRSIQFVVTARTGMWLPQHTAELQHFLADGRATEPKVLQITFSSLDEEALRTLAVGYGANNVDELVAALRREEIRSLFDIRPRDVSWLVRKWNKSGQLGKWTELLSDFCESALTDEPHDRALHRELSARDGQLGLQRAAAAMLLGKKGYISVPSAERSDQTISSRRLFDDWTTLKVQNLLETALFVHKGMNGQAVQLAADTLTPFLAARWFARRVRAGLDIDSLQQHVMVRAFGEREFHIPASRTALAGWLATELPEFRGLVLRDRPDIVLFRGDPELLTDHEIETGLAAIAGELLAGAMDWYPRSAALRKLARASIECLVLSLLSTRPTAEGLQVLALELARHGRYRTCVPTAVALALDRTATERVRTEAIAAVLEVGDQLAREKLIALTDDPLASIRTELLAAVPHTIAGAALVRLMQHGGDLSFRLAVRRMVGRVGDVDLDAIAEALAPVVGRTVIDRLTEPTYCAALPVVTESIRRGRASAATVRIVRGIEYLVEHAAVFISDEEAMELRVAFEDQPQCRHALIEARLDDGVARPYSVGRGRFGQATLEDVPWLVNAFTEQRGHEPSRPPEPSAPQRSDLIVWVLDALYDRLEGEQQEAVRAALPEILRERVDARVQSSFELAAERVRNDAERACEAAAERAENAAAIRVRLQQLEAGDDVPALRWAWRHLGDEYGAKRARRDVSRLAAAVGDDLVPSFLRGLKAFWRKNAVLAPDGNTFRVDDLAGLTGLTLEIDSGLDLGTLSPAEARLAATYALYELNQFPYWFDDLLAAQPAATTAVLREAVARAWTATADNPTLLRFGPYATQRIAGALRSLLLELADTTPPGARHAQQDGIDTLLTSGDEPRRVANIAITGLEADAGDDGRVSQWLRLLAHIDPIAAAERLESMRTTDLDHYRRIIEGVADSLERDVSDRYQMSLVTALNSPRALGRWFRLLLLGVSPENDLEPPTQEMRVMGSRDHAQDFRNRCVALLRKDPTHAARDVLLELAGDPALVGYRSSLVAAVDDQLEVARESAALTWTEDEVLAVEQGDEHPPRTLDDLFAMVRSHIVHVDRLISVDDDFSYRSLFQKQTPEEKIQLWAASSLRERARGLYSVIRENVVAAKKEVDISAMAPGVGQVPIEIKPLGQYSFNALKDVIEHQLLGQYMRARDRRYGVLLLVRRERTRWDIGGKRLALDRLVHELQAFADHIGRKNDKTIVVEAIDLLEQLGSASLWRLARSK